MKNPYSVPKSMLEKYERISDLTDNFCTAKLNEEYADMCRMMTAKLCRKRPSPLTTGRPQNWAAGVVHAVGTVNFAFDISLDPHISVTDISDYFGVGKSIPASKSKVIRDLFKIGLMDPEWTLPSRIKDNPMVWTIQVDDIIIDARYAPPYIQEIAYEQGIIPYIPYLRDQE
ncbi:MAG: DUF6398 domain-containing protein [Candidatus Promineifilaceae bacterium]|nr:DUF6398 domain-containing protein [Candidatus Promineifilaceae bacterium]